MDGRNDLPASFENDKEPQIKSIQPKELKRIVDMRSVHSSITAR